jgi:prophage tail gpP-like protein
MREEIMSLTISSTKYTGWKDIQVERAIENVCGRFNCQLIDSTDSVNPALVPGVACTIDIDGTTILNGYIDSVKVNLTENQFTYQISGRDKTGDIVDGCVDIRPGTWKKQSIVQFATILAFAADLKVKSTEFEDEKADFTVEIGDTILAALQRGTKSRAVLLLTDTQTGDLLLTTAGRNRASDSLVIGQNVKSIDFTIDHTNRFNIYRIKTQKTSGGSGWGSSPSTITVNGSATDANIRSSRLLLLNGEDQLTKSLAEKRAQWEASVRNAMSTTIDVVLPGFYQSTGGLWKENTLVHLSGGYGNFNLDTDCLISAVSYTIDSNGKTTSLQLRDPKAYTPQPSIPKKSKTVKGVAKWL